MALHRDLLDQARSLAAKEPKRPKQASLRRATSAAYYALFHFLTQAGSRFLISGTGPARELLRQGVARAFNHAHMKKTSQAFAQGHSNPWTALVQDQPIPAPVRRAARTFVDLQQARHEADYDQVRAFTRSEVLAHIKQAEQAIDQFESIRSHPVGETYLVALLLNTRR